MGKPDRHREDRLLAGRPGLSVVEKEAMLERLLRDPEIRPRRSALIRWRPLVAFAGTAAEVALTVVLALPDPEPELVARGAGPGARLAVSCASGACRPGDTLRFRVVHPAERPWLSVFARRADGAVIWYFPEHGDGQSVRSPSPPGWLGRGVRLGPEHTPGRYRIIGLFTREPAGRAAVRDTIRAGGHGDAVVVETTLEVEEP